jgi:hypothetical protein
VFIDIIINALRIPIFRAISDAGLQFTPEKEIYFNDERAWKNVFLAFDLEVTFGTYDGSRDAHGFEIGEGFIPGPMELKVGERITFSIPRSIRTQPCMMCRKVHYLTVDVEGLEKYQRGDYVQDAFWYLSADEREMLISGTDPACWKKLWADVEED